MIQIDGSVGEGGGQILRTALSLSLATGQAFRVANIRAGREKPGLLRQHLTAVRAAAEVSGAACEGAVLGSKALTFAPGKVRPGDYHFVVGTAGSSTLVFQTVLPALMTASGKSRLVIEGGTHNTAAPPFEFIERSFLPLISRMGPTVRVELERYGFYPAGGGRFIAEIDPSPVLRPIELGERGKITSRRAVAIVANLPRHIGQREIETVAKMMDFVPQSLVIQQTQDSAGPGNVLMIELASASVVETFTSFGRLGVSAEKVAADAVRQAREYLASRAAAGEHLTDQLLLPMALAGAGSLAAVKLSLHARTNVEVISMFLPVRFDTTECDGYVRVQVQKRQFAPGEHATQDESTRPAGGHR